MSGVLKTNFFPQEDLDFLYVDIEMPPGTTLAVTDLTAREVEEALYSAPNIDSFITSVGGLSSFGNAAFGGSPSNGERFANITINLPEERALSSTEILEDIKKRVSTIKSGIVHAAIQQPTHSAQAVDLNLFQPSRRLNRSDTSFARRTSSQSLA